MAGAVLRVSAMRLRGLDNLGCSVPGSLRIGLHRLHRLVLAGSGKPLLGPHPGDRHSRGCINLVYNPRRFPRYKPRKSRPSGTGGQLQDRRQYWVQRVGDTPVERELTGSGTRPRGSPPSASLRPARSHSPGQHPRLRRRPRTRHPEMRSSPGSEQAMVVTAQTLGSKSEGVAPAGVARALTCRAVRPHRPRVRLRRHTQRRTRRGRRRGRRFVRQGQRAGPNGLTWE
jgi:hypothetical protein